MLLYESCPVCAYAVTTSERCCPCCAWELEGDYQFGRLTAAEQRQQEELLQQARQRWRVHQQQHAAKRTLAAAQARLRYVQQRCQRAHIRRVMRLPTAELAKATPDPTTKDAPSAVEASPSTPSPGYYPLRWFRLLWWALFRRGRATASCQPQNHH